MRAAADGLPSVELREGGGGGDEGLGGVKLPQFGHWVALTSDDRLALSSDDSRSVSEGGSTAAVAQLPNGHEGTGRKGWKQMDIACS